MTNWIFNNKEWLFSGIGVLMLSFVMSKISRIFRGKPSATMEQISGNNSTNLQANRDISIKNIHITKASSNEGNSKLPERKKYKTEVETQNIEVSIKEGNYVDIPWVSPYRITVKHIVNEDFKQHYGELSLEGADIHVKTGGSLVFGGEYAKKSNGVNQWKIPLKHESNEEPYSIYSYFVYEDSLSFFRCFISHINPHSKEVTLNIYITSFR